MIATNHDTRQLLSKLLGLGGHAGSGALAALVLNNPIGAAGGTVVGAVGYLAGRPVMAICDEVFNSNKMGASLISIIIGAAAAFFATAGISQAVASSLGYALSFKAACLLSAASQGIALGIAFTAVVLAETTYRAFFGNRSHSY
jgi:hypothetical protein